MHQISARDLPLNTSKNKRFASIAAKKHAHAELIVLYGLEFNGKIIIIQ